MSQPESKKQNESGGSLFFGGIKRLVTLQGALPTMHTKQLQAVRREDIF